MDSYPGEIFSMRANLLIKTFGALSVLCLASCETFQKAKFNLGRGVEEELLLVVPFSEPRRSRWYGESSHGKEVVQSFKVWARRQALPNFAEGDEVERIQRLVRNWSKEKISGKDWMKLTMGTGIKYVLYGEIDQLSLTSRARVGILEPSVMASYRVVDAQRGKLVFEELRSQVRYGGTESAETIAVDIGRNVDTSKRRLIAKLGRQIGKDLYGYYEEW
jgi:hypothetical protein